MQIALVSFHGPDLETAKLNVISISGEEEQERVMAKLQTHYGSERVQLIESPIRFKQSDDDYRDFNNPVPLRDDLSKIFTQRKIFKLQIVNDPQYPQQQSYSNLRVFVEREELNAELYIQISNQYIPQTQQDWLHATTQFNGDFQTYYVLNDFEKNNQFDIFRGVFWSPQFLSSPDYDKRFFGELPFIYIQAQFSPSKNQSGILNFKIYFAFDVF